jgi:hypothetical protein
MKVKQSGSIALFENSRHRIKISILFHGKFYSIHYLIKFVLDLRQVGDFLCVPRFHPQIKLTATITEILLKLRGVIKKKTDTISVITIPGNCLRDRPDVKQKVIQMLEVNCLCNKL